MSHLMISPPPAKTLPRRCTFFRVASPPPSPVPEYEWRPCAHLLLRPRFFARPGASRPRPPIRCNAVISRDAELRRGWCSRAS